MTWKQYWYEHDIDMLNNAIEVSEMSKEVSDKIFIKEKPQAFAIF